MLWLIQALALASKRIRGARCLVLGSNSITIESLLLAFNMSHVTVAEYNPLTFDHPQIDTTQHLECDQSEQPRYDIILAISR